MSPESIKEELILILKNDIGIEEIEQIIAEGSDSIPIIEIGIDSLELTEFIIQIETTFEISIGKEEAEKYFKFDTANLDEITRFIIDKRNDKRIST